jgi:hypothetical protein
VWNNKPPLRKIFFMKPDMTSKINMFGW